MHAYYGKKSDLLQIIAKTDTTATREAYRADHGVIGRHESVRVLNEEGYNQGRRCSEPY